LSWLFQIVRGRILKPNGQLHCAAYSGAPGFIDNPQFECFKNLGPICEGVYDMVAMVDDPEHGPDCIILKPRFGNMMYGRDGFMWHGDSKKHPGCASLGCVVSIRLARDAAWQSNDHVFEVVKECQLKSLTTLSV
jgi:hypothetical protein